MKTETEKFAELLVSMSTDFLLNKITEQHYKKMLEMVSNRLNPINDEQHQNMCFKLAEKLESKFDIRYIGSDRVENAYEIEGQIRTALKETYLTITNYTVNNY